MKIGLVSEEYPKETTFGWIATYHRTLAHSLSNLGYKVFVFCRTFKKSHIVNDGNIIEVRIKWLFARNDFLFNTIWYRISILFRIRKINIVHKLDVIEVAERKAEAIFYILLIKRFFKTKIIVKLHTPLVICQEFNNLPNNLVNRLQKTFEKLQVNKADAVYSCSKILKDMLTKINFCKDIEVIHNVPNIFEFGSGIESNCILDENSNPIYKKEGVIDILFVGSLELRKWIEVVMKTFTKLCTINNHNLRLLLCGAYWDSYNANSKLSKEEILSFTPRQYQSKIYFLWKKPYDQMKEIYNFADIGFFPSLFDNYPGVVLEALLCELPSIWSKHTGITETCVDWRDILFCDPNDLDNCYFLLSWLVGNTKRLSIWISWHVTIIQTYYDCLNKTLKLYKK